MMEYVELYETVHNGTAIVSADGASDKDQRLLVTVNEYAAEGWAVFSHQTPADKSGGWLTVILMQRQVP